MQNLASAPAPDPVPTSDAASGWRMIRLLRGVYTASITLTAFAIGLGCALGWFDAGPAGKPVVAKSQISGPNGSLSHSADGYGRVASSDSADRPKRSLSAVSLQAVTRPTPALIAEHIRTVMALTSPEREAAMDKDIDLMQQIAEHLRKQRAEAKTSEGDTKQAGDGPGTSNPLASMTSAHADRNRMLSSMSAEQRASANNNRQLFQAYQALLQGRAAERGIKLPTFGAAQ